MTQDEIIEMARQAGITVEAGGRSYEQLLRIINAFAKLVAQHERDRCAKLRDELHFHHFDKTASVSKAELVASVEQALDDYAKLIRTGDV
jgi:hypothetical protein